jgi:hypothetical protein
MTDVDVCAEALEGALEAEEPDEEAVGVRDREPARSPDEQGGGDLAEQLGRSDGAEREGRCVHGGCCWKVVAQVVSDEGAVELALIARQEQHVDVVVVECSQRFLNGQAEAVRLGCRHHGVGDAGQTCLARGARGLLCLLECFG